MQGLAYHESEALDTDWKHIFENRNETVGNYFFFKKSILFGRRAFQERFKRSVFLFIGKSPKEFGTFRKVLESSGLYKNALLTPPKKIANVS